MRKGIIGIFLMLVALTNGWTASSPVAIMADYESARLQVLKVFSAKDGEATYRAYLVKWKDQEVIVPDTLIKTNYREGDTANVLVMRHKYPNDKKGPDLLSFALGAQRP